MTKVEEDPRPETTFLHLYGSIQRLLEKCDLNSADEIEELKKALYQRINPLYDEYGIPKDPKEEIDDLIDIELQRRTSPDNKALPDRKTDALKSLEERMSHSPKDALDLEPRKPNEIDTVLDYAELLKSGKIGKQEFISRAYKSFKDQDLEEPRRLAEAWADRILTGSATDYDVEKYRGVTFEPDIEDDRPVKETIKNEPKEVADSQPTLIPIPDENLSVPKEQLLTNFSLAPAGSGNPEESGQAQTETVSLTLGQQEQLEQFDTLLRREKIDLNEYVQQTTKLISTGIPEETAKRMAQQRASGIALEAALNKIENTGNSSALTVHGTQRPNKPKLSNRDKEALAAMEVAESNDSGGIDSSQGPAIKTIDTQSDTSLLSDEDRSRMVKEKFEKERKKLKDELDKGSINNAQFQEELKKIKLREENVGRPQMDPAESKSHHYGKEILDIDLLLEDPQRWRLKHPEYPAFDRVVRTDSRGNTYTSYQPVLASEMVGGGNIIYPSVQKAREAIKSWPDASEQAKAQTLAVLDQMEKSGTTKSVKVSVFKDSRGNPRMSVEPAASEKSAKEKLLFYAQKDITQEVQRQVGRQIGKLVNPEYIPTEIIRQHDLIIQALPKDTNWRKLASGLSPVARASLITSGLGLEGVNLAVNALRSTVLNSPDVSWKLKVAALIPDDTVRSGITMMVRKQGNLIRNFIHKHYKTEEKPVVTPVLPNKIADIHPEGYRLKDAAERNVAINLNQMSHNAAIEWISQFIAPERQQDALIKLETIPWDWEVGIKVIEDGRVTIYGNAPRHFQPRSDFQPRDFHPSNRSEVKDQSNRSEKSKSHSIKSESKYGKFDASSPREPKAVDDSPSEVRVAEAKPG